MFDALQYAPVVSVRVVYLWFSFNKVPMVSAKTRVMIIAGETSGDLHAAGLVQAMSAQLPNGTLEVFGCAGHAMRAAGVEAIVNSDDLAIVGLLEIGRALPRFIDAWRLLKAAMLQRRPDVVILVDFPDFNLKFARLARKHGIRVVYYISPQLWAWRGYRIRTIRKNVDLLLSILPFEKDWYAAKGVDHVEYVGNPTGNHVNASTSREEFRRLHNLGDGQVIALLPGSRSKEIERILPVMLDTFLSLKVNEPNLKAIIAAAGPRQQQQIDSIVRESNLANSDVHVVTGATYDLLNAADAAAVTSGTATLEAGIIGTPMVVVYRSSSVNYRLLKPLISVEHYGLVNLIGGERIATELIQYELTPERLASELTALLEPMNNQAMRKKLEGLRHKLGDIQAADTAARAIIQLINN